MTLKRTFVAITLIITTSWAIILSGTWSVVVAVLEVLPLRRAGLIVIVSTHVALRGTLVIRTWIPIATVGVWATPAPAATSTTTAETSSSRRPAPVIVVGSVRPRTKVAAASAWPLIGRAAIRMVSIHFLNDFRGYLLNSRVRIALSDVSRIRCSCQLKVQTAESVACSRFKEVSQGDENQLRRRRGTKRCR